MLMEKSNACYISCWTEGTSTHSFPMLKSCQLFLPYLPNSESHPFSLKKIITALVLIGFRISLNVRDVSF
uniref:Ovule protein n=1 Tax=Strongyloides venezuelensis TaxID=75913 RepID=A0A0K0FTT6_STRVS